MRLVISLLILLIFAPEFYGQGRDVTVTSYVYGSRFCASVTGVSAVLAAAMGSDDTIGPPSEQCAEACTADGDRFLLERRGEKNMIYKISNAVELGGMCGKKVVVHGTATPTDKETVESLQVISVKPYTEPKAMPLPTAKFISPAFAAAARSWFTALKLVEDGGPVPAADADQANALKLQKNTADEAVAAILKGYNIGLHRDRAAQAMAAINESLKKEAEADHAKWKTVFDTCRAEITASLAAKAAVANSQCISGTRF